uniref:Uncharacterized protein n=1 Tax=Arundo donax TaxID=35708 RepID=A0A0A9AR99_ARUDO
MCRLDGGSFLLNKSTSNTFFSRRCHAHSILVSYMITRSCLGHNASTIHQDNRHIWY